MLGAVTGKQARELRPGGRWVRIFSAAVVAGFIEKGRLDADLQRGSEWVAWVAGGRGTGR